MNKYFLHFIGKGLYSKEEFILESEKFGVNRAFPANISKHMKFGDKILLSQFEPIHLDSETDKRKNKEGRAVVMGYYIVDSVNFDAQNSKEFYEKLYSQLDIVSTTNVNKTVSRRCGSYTLGTVIYVNDSLEDIVTKAVKIAEELKIKIKSFISGKFYQFTMKEISPIKFTQIGTWIELDKDLTGEVKDKQVGFIGDYKQRRYFLKEETEKVIE